MSNNLIYKYGIYCNTSNTMEYVWDTSPPTTCPINGSHTVNSNSVHIADTAIYNTFVAGEIASYNAVPEFMVCETGSGSLTIVLPSATAGSSGVFRIKNNGSNNVIVESDYVTIKTIGAGEIYLARSDGSAWQELNIKFDIGRDKNVSLDNYHTNKTLLHSIYQSVPLETRRLLTGENTFTAGNTFKGDNNFTGTNTFINTTNFLSDVTFAGGNTFTGQNTFNNTTLFQSGVTLAGQLNVSGNALFQSGVTMSGTTTTIVSGSNSLVISASGMTFTGDVGFNSIHTFSGQNIFTSGSTTTFDGGVTLNNKIYTRNGIITNSVTNKTIIGGITNWAVAGETSSTGSVSLADEACWSPDLGLFVAVGYSYIATSSHGLTWNYVPAPFSGGWWSICWSSELSIFVAVASSGTNRVMTSTNGFNWTSVSCPSNSWKSVCWSPELRIFVAVANNNSSSDVMTSSNGTDWTTRTSASGNWWKVIWSAELGIFVAVAISGSNLVMTSSNGTSWTPRTAAENNSWWSICWSPELSIFVAVASTGTNRIMTSSNGINWTGYPSPIQSDWRSITWSSELGIFVAISVSGTNIIYSYNGTTWNSLPRPSGNQNFILWSAELGIFVTNRLYSSPLYRVTKKDNKYHGSIGSDGNYQFYGLVSKGATFTSGIISTGLITAHSGITASSIITGGITSSQITISGNALFQSGVTFNGGNTFIGQNTFNNTTLFRSGVTFRNKIYTNNGIITTSRSNYEINKAISSWTTRATPADNNWYSICWSPKLSLFAAISQTGTNRIMTSPNGINWTSVSVPQYLWTDIVWSPELEIFVAISDDFFLTSSNGITWNSQSVTAGSWRSICWSPNLGRFVAISLTGNSVLTSTNGTSWSFSTISGTVYPWYSVCWSPELGIFVAVSNSNSVFATSTNGTSWTVLTTSLGTYTAYQICWSSDLGIFVVVGDGGIIWSTDGTNWTRVNISLFSASSIAWSPELGIFIGVGENTTNRLAYSYNGINWTLVSSYSTIGFTKVCWSPELGIFVAVSETGTGNRAITSDLNYRVTKKDNRYHGSIGTTGDYKFYNLTSGGATFTSGVTMTGPLTIGSTAIFQSGVTFNGGNTFTGQNTFNNTTLFQSGVTTSGQLTVSGNAIFQSGVTTNGQLTVSGNALFQSGVTFNGGNTFTAQNTFNTATFNSGVTLLNKIYTRNGIITNSVTNKTIINGITNWSTRASSDDKSWNSVCWSPELGLFVAVSSAGISSPQVMISSNGINWTSISVTGNFISVCWSPERNIFVAVGQSGSVITSSDGINWTSRTSGNTYEWFSVCWSAEKNLFVAVGYETSTCYVMNSSDGITWSSAISISSATSVWYSVCWASELGIFVASGNVGGIMTSSDGSVWNYVTTGNTNTWFSICWSPELGLFIAVATNSVMTSSNGINWSTTITVTGNWQSVCWSPEFGMFVSIGYLGTNRLMFSPNGTNWTTVNITANSWQSICWSPELGIFVAVANSGTGNRVLTSSLTNRVTKKDNKYHGSIGITGDYKFYNLTSGGATFTSGVTMTGPLTIGSTAIFQSGVTFNGGNTFTGQNTFNNTTLFQSGVTMSGATTTIVSGSNRLVISSSGMTFTGDVGFNSVHTFSGQNIFTNGSTTTFNGGVTFKSNVTVTGNLVIPSLSSYPSEPYPIDVSISDSNTYILLSNGTISAYGLNSYGQLGNGITSGYSTIPVNPLGITTAIKVVSLSPGPGTLGYIETSVLTLLSNGSVMGWGANHAGQLGIGETTNPIPIPQIIPDLSGVTNIALSYVLYSVGLATSYFLLNDGSIKVCGDNSEGQFGIGISGGYTSVPTIIPDISNAIYIAGGFSRGAAILNDNTVRVWGNNDIGALGIGIEGNTYIPTVVRDSSGNTLNNIIKLSIGVQHLLFLTAGGTVYGSGNGGEGSLASLTSTYNTANIIPDVTNVRDIHANFQVSVFLLNDGTVVTCGKGSPPSGYIGLGYEAFGGTNVPTDIGLSNVRSIPNSGNGYHELVILNNYFIYSFGKNDYGQLGIDLGNTLDYITPILSSIYSDNIYIDSSLEISNKLITPYSYSNPISGNQLYVSQSGTLGVLASSSKYKDNIVPINGITNIYNLQPVSFTYKFDNTNKTQYGLIAENTKDIIPEMITYDNNGQIFSVNYQFLPVLMLAEMKNLKRENDYLKSELSSLKQIVYNLAGITNS